MTVPLYNLTDTWNDGGTVFTAIKMDVTDTASAAESRLIDLQVGGTSFFNFAPVSGGSVRPCLRLGNAATTGVLEILSGGRGFWTSGGFYVSTFNTDVIQFNLSTGNLLLTFDGDDILAQRRTTVAQTFRIYNTYTNASNYERGVFDWSATGNVFTIDVQVLGTGTQRVISLGHLDSATGAGTATFAATNCPATTLTTPYTWIKVTSSDGSIVYMPAWK